MMDKRVQSAREATEAQLAAYMESLSNWGRWGDDDQLGALNFITPAKRAAAAQLVRNGEVVSTSLPLPTTPGPNNPQPALHFMLSTGEKKSNGGKDFFGCACHGRNTSHIDALCHRFWRGKMYNGVLADVVRADGAHRNAIHSVADKVSGRGVLLDVPLAKGEKWLTPGEPVFIEDLEAAERAHGVRVEEGDLLLIRTGRLCAERPGRTDLAPLAGLHDSVLPWLHERRVAVLGSDGVNDIVHHASGSPKMSLPIHTVGLVAMGLHLLDNQDLEPLAAACQRLSRYAFFFVVAPLNLEKGTGSPVTGLAMF